MKVKVDDLPLMDLFHQLREKGLPLVIDDYCLLLKALQAGFGLSDLDALARLCCNLWVKSEEEKRVFDSCFQSVIAQVSLPSLVAEKSVSEELESEVISAVETFSGGEDLPGDLSGESPTGNSRSDSGTGNPIELGELTVNRDSNTSAVIDLFIDLWERGQMGGKTEWKKPDSKLDLRELFDNFSPGEGSGEKTFDDSAKLNLETGDEIEVAKSVAQSGEENGGISESSFILRSEYFPVTKRQMKQSWRFLRRPIREGQPTELDVKGTVERAGREGIMLAPVLVPRRVNRTQLILLIDWEGSMVPFYALSQRLAETAIRGGRLQKPNVFYFHNCPVERVYVKPNNPETRKIEDIFAKVKPDRGAVLIFSDAGAARGGYNRERVELTGEFLREVRRAVRYVAWINPIPQGRWDGTTAGEIAELVPMFEITRRGLQGAIAVLRGKRRELSWGSGR